MNEKIVTINLRLGTIEDFIGYGMMGDYLKKSIPYFNLLKDGSLYGPIYQSDVFYSLRFFEICKNVSFVIDQTKGEQYNVSIRKAKVEDFFISNKYREDNKLYFTKHDQNNVNGPYFFTSKINEKALRVLIKKENVFVFCDKQRISREVTKD